MASLNKVILIGRLTRDPQLVTFPSNPQPVCRFGLAVNRRYRTSDGVDHEETTFLEINVYGRTGENCARYLAKGRQVYVEGSLKLDVWTGRDEKEHTTLRVSADRILFIDSQGMPAAGEPPAARPAAVRDFMPRPAGTAPLPAPVPIPPTEALPSDAPPPVPETTAEPPIDDIPF